jgi:SAM-dependent methyltransferase
MTLDTIYDHPLYYDILFGWDRSAEAGFYSDVFARAGIGEGDRVLEVACGTGQIARRLASRGFLLCGLDLSEAMLGFLRDQATADGVTVETLRADMERFESPERFAAAFNPMSSFRMIHERAASIAHLRCVAKALRPGGLYVLDLEFAAADGGAAVTTEEAWDMTRGPVTVRASDDAVFVDDGGTKLELGWGDEIHLVAMTREAFSSRVTESACFAIESWHPEVRAAGDDVSRFRAEPGERPELGRTMVVLRAD